MASVASLREHLVDELNDLLNAEHQLIEALPKMVEHASSRELRAAFKAHLAETRQHERRAAQALKKLGETASSTTCEAIKGLLEDGQELMDSADAGALRDAMMITAAQKVEHYEIASDGTVRTYARVLGENAVATLLDHTLKQEKAADQKLPRLRKVRSTDELPGSGRSRPAPRKKRPACCRRAPSGSAPPSAARSQS